MNCVFIFYPQDVAQSCGKHHKWSFLLETQRRYLLLFAVKGRKGNVRVLDKIEKIVSSSYIFVNGKTWRDWTLACSSSSNSSTPAPSPITNPSRSWHIRVDNKIKIITLMYILLQTISIRPSQFLIAKKKSLLNPLQKELRMLKDNNLAYFSWLCY